MNRAIVNSDIETLAELYCHNYIEAQHAPAGEKLTNGDIQEMSLALDTSEKVAEFEGHVVFFHSLRECAQLVCGCYYMYESALCGTAGVFAKYLLLKARMESEQNAEARAELQTAMEGVDLNEMVERVKFSRMQYSSVIRSMVEMYGKNKHIWRFIPHIIQADFEDFEKGRDSAMGACMYVLNGSTELTDFFIERLKDVPTLWDSSYDEGYQATILEKMEVYENGWRAKAK